MSKSKALLEAEKQVEILAYVKKELIAQLKDARKAIKKLEKENELLREENECLNREMAMKKGRRKKTRQDSVEEERRAFQKKLNEEYPYPNSSDGENIQHVMRIAPT